MKMIAHLLPMQPL